MTVVQMVAAGALPAAGLARSIGRARAAVLAALGLSSCTTSFGHDPVGEPPPTRLLLTVQRAPASVLSGTSVEVLVAVARDGRDAFAGEVELRLDPVAGLSAAPFVLDRLSTTATLTVAADVARNHGDVELVVRGTSRTSDLTGEARFPIQVRGAPGALDSGFADGGVFDLGEADAEATAAMALPDRKTLLGGRIGRDAAIVRLDAAGRRDPTFGVDGVVRASIPNLLSTNGMAIAGEAIALGGTAGSPPRGIVVRLDLQGKTSPAVVTAASLEEARALAAGDRANFVLGGRGLTAPSLAAVGLRSDGAVDDAFGREGTALLPFDAACTRTNGCAIDTLAARDSGRMTSCSATGSGALIRELTPEGVSDPIYELTTTSDVLERCTAIANNGPRDLWVSGERSGGKFAIVYFEIPPGGGPLRHNQYFAPVLPFADQWGAATAVAIGGPGYIVITANAPRAGGSTEFTLLRLTAYGLLDPTFGAGKSYVTTAIGQAPSITRALAVAADGRIVVAGSNGRMIAARYWP